MAESIPTATDQAAATTPPVKPSPTLTTASRVVDSLLNTVAIVALIVAVLSIIGIVPPDGAKITAQDMALLLIIPVVVLLSKSIGKLKIGASGIEVDIREQVIDTNNKVTLAVDELNKVLLRVEAANRLLDTVELAVTRGVGGKSAENNATESTRSTAFRDVPPSERRATGFSRSDAKGYGAGTSTGSTGNEESGDSSAGDEGSAFTWRGARVERLGPGGEPIVPDDPQKNQWGKEAIRNGLQLRAKVAPVRDSSSLYKVGLEVVSLAAPDRLKGTVDFHLHDTFPMQKQTVKVGSDGIARLELIAWGAFTVGAVADGGDTPLELDLASDKVDAPPEFKRR